MSIKNYAIIDHVGSVTEDEMKRVYKLVYHQASKDGFTKDSCPTLKKVCMADSPFARKVTDNMKYRARYTKNPKRVYFIANKLNSKSETELRKWCKRGIDIVLYNVKDEEICTYDRKMMVASPFVEWEKKNTQLDDGINDIKVQRCIASIWAPAFHYYFSTDTIIRYQDTIVPDNFIKRPDHDEMVASGETHFTKPFTSSAKFIEKNREIVTDEEIKEFIKYFEAYLKLTGCKVELRPNEYFGSVSGNIEALSEFLEIDYTICKHCHRPRKLTQERNRYGKQIKGSVCPHCEAEFNEGRLGYDTYYEDNYFEDDEMYIDTTEDTEYQEDVYYNNLESEF